MSSLRSNNRQWKDGIIITDTGETLARPGMTLADFRLSALGASAEITGFSPEYPQAKLTSVWIGGYECATALIFHHNRLNEVTIVVTEDTANRYGFVTGFAASADGLEVRFLEQWVERELGQKPPAAFPWGRINSTYDSHAGFARIKFLYRE